MHLDLSAAALIKELADIIGSYRYPFSSRTQTRKAIKRRDRDGEPVREIARSYNVNQATNSRLSNGPIED